MAVTVATAVAVAVPVAMTVVAVAVATIAAAAATATATHRFCKDAQNSSTHMVQEGLTSTASPHPVAKWEIENV